MTNTVGVGRQPGWVPDTTTFGARLALVRQAMGWNLAEAATECGIPVASWRGWENRGKEPRGMVSACMKIAGVTGVDVDWLLRGPIAERPAAELGAVGITKKYVDERVVAVIDNGPKRVIDSTANRGSLRTRPIARHLSVQSV